MHKIWYRQYQISTYWDTLLCELVQHLSIFDYIAVSASLDNRVLEYVDHLHEHFVDPVVIRNGRYMPPEKPGYSAALKPASLRDYTFPTGAAWQANAIRTDPN
jgi:L-fuconate dehydratase